MNESNLLLISIPQPCYEDWNSMTPSFQGRHCSHCNQVVIDFTSMTDEEILNVIQTSKSSICGRLKNSQLSEPKPIKLSRVVKLFLKALAIGFLLHTSESTNAQIQVQTDSVLNQEKATIKGTVKGNNKEYLDFATVTVIQGGIIKGGAKTDRNGKFVINQIAPGKYNLKVTYIGYIEFILTNVLIKSGQTITIDPILEKMKATKRSVQMITYGRINIIQPSEPNRKIIRQEQINHFPY